MAMATLYNFSTFHTLSSPKLFLSCPLPFSPNSQIKYKKTVLASAYKKPSPSSRKTGKNVKSNEDLVNDIREFLYSVGLQDNRVPSIKELSHHGRQDLANIVRRRGYKLITELLQNSIPKNIDTFQNENLEAPTEFEGQNKKTIYLADDEFSSEAIVEAGSQSGKENDGELKLDDQSSLLEESATLSLQEKVSRFIQHGELDTVEDISFGGNAREPELALNQMQKKALSSGAESLNGSVPSSVQKVDNSLLDNKRRSSVDSCEDLDAEYMENEAEVERLKFMLHQKEIELTRLKQQIENEKLALSVLQTKAETEISKAQKLVTEKETELLAAEESLSGLKEVEIHYFGDGETVELAGSFNGWDQRIKLDLQSSSITDPDKSMTSRLWGAVLWLYPGVYEIKFIIDGHWRIDPKRESVTRGSVNNNILRVR